MNPNKPLLLVEDDVVDVMLLKRVLVRLKTTNPLSVASNGEEALEYLRDPAHERPGIILLDLNMPRMNGIEFLQVLKDDAQLRLIPVVVLTTSKHQRDKIACFERSVAGYMVKPVDYDQFVVTMEKVLDYWALSEIPD